MKTKLLLTLGAACAAIATPSFAQDQWQATAGLMRFSEDAIDVDALYVTLGYKFKAAENFYIIPEARVATGIGDDNGIEVDTFYSIGAKAQYEFESGFYTFATISWGDLKVKSNGGSGSDDEVGYGVGAGYDFTEKVGAELSWEDFQDTNLYQLGLKFKF